MKIGRNAGVGWALIVASAACSKGGTASRQAALQPMGTAGSAASSTPIAVMMGPAASSDPSLTPPPPSALPLVLGEPIAFLPGSGEVPYTLGPNPFGISGTGFLARAALGNSISVGTEPGKICVQGNLESVPNGDYGEYWGVELGFNLAPLAAANPTPNALVPSTARADAGSRARATAAVDAGRDARTAAAADAAVVASADPSSSAPAAPPAAPWKPGKVIGFSFVIEGPTIDVVRFKSLPDGYVGALESSVFCKQVTPASGAAEPVLFSDMTQYCWDAPQQAPLPLAQGLDNLSWQLPADASGARAFDWCLSDLRPILAP